MSADAMASAQPTDRGSADRLVAGPIASVQSALELKDSVSWQFAAAIYLGGEWPRLSDDWISTWLELIELDRQQILNLLAGTGDQKQTASILNQVDAIARLLSDQSDVSRVLSAWWQTEKMRVPPGDLKSVATRFLEINDQLLNALERVSDSKSRETEKNGDRPNVDL